MLFRVTYTNDIDKHYGPNPLDTSLSTVVTASSFNEAIEKADRKLGAYLSSAGFLAFEVSGVKILEPEED